MDTLTVGPHEYQWIVFPLSGVKTSFFRVKELFNFNTEASSGFLNGQLRLSFRKEVKGLIKEAYLTKDSDPCLAVNMKQSSTTSATNRLNIRNF